MSKSLRNAVDPLGIARASAASRRRAAGADVLRYQLLRAIAFGQDGDFDLAAMIERYNADLGKNLGQPALAHARALREDDRRARCRDGEPLRLETELHEPIEAAATSRRSSTGTRSRRTARSRATWAIASPANQYVDRAAPWAEDEEGRPRRASRRSSRTLLEVLEAPQRHDLAGAADEERRDARAARARADRAERCGQDLLAARRSRRAARGRGARARRRRSFPTHRRGRREGRCSTSSLPKVLTRPRCAAAPRRRRCRRLRARPRRARPRDHRTTSSRPSICASASSARASGCRRRTSCSG